MTPTPRLGYSPGMAADRLRINEIFHSIQGEGTRAGLPCVFIRLTGCHLRCSYCDTEYAFHEGGWMTLDRIQDRVREYGCPTVEVTGGEPLLQPAVYPLMTRLADEFRTVMLETSGAVRIDRVDPRVARIVDFKCPSSGEAARNCWDNVALLRPGDEVKFVIGDRADYEWSRAIVAEHNLAAVCPVLFSPVFDRIEPVELANWILADGMDVRMQLQLHKLIWSPQTRGV
jgi:7-carboxy-7-deazaguanine synthase